MYKAYKNTHAFPIHTANLYKLVLICKFMGNNRRVKRFAQETEEIGTFYSCGRQFSLRQVGIQSRQYTDGTLYENHFTIKSNSPVILVIIYFRYAFFPSESNDPLKVATA